MNQKPAFDERAQLAFGAAMGGLLRDVQDRHALRNEDLVMIMAQILAGWAIDAKMPNQTLLKIVDAAHRSAHNGLLKTPEIKVV